MPPLRASLLRHTVGRPCPICGGHSALPKGRGIRCAGFTVAELAYCTREEFAGKALLDISTQPPAYRHRLHGACYCGNEHVGPAYRAPRAQPPSANVTAALPLLDGQTTDEIFTAALNLLALRPEARFDLLRRGLTEHDLLLVGYKSTASPRGPASRHGHDQQIRKR